MSNTFVNTIVFVADLERSKRFYADMLALPIDKDLGNIVFFENRLVLHDASSITQTVFNGTRLPEGRVLGRGNLLIYIETNQLEAMYAQLVNRVELIHGIEKQAWGQRVFRFHDPDGHIVEIGEPETLAKL